VNTLEQFRKQCLQSLRSALQLTFPDWVDKIPRPIVPPDIKFGELASSIAYDIAGKERLQPQEVAEKIATAVHVTENSNIAKVEAVAGYVNFRLDYRTAGRSILKAALSQDASYGIEKTEQPVSTAVEHTSANPSGPLTMGHARNAILGDALARLLSARGHSVKRRFYIDDVGRQVSILAYGYRLLGRPRPKGKADHWLGLLYACTNTAVEIEATKRKLNELGTEYDDEKRGTLQRNLDEWVGIAADLETLDKALFSQVVDAVKAEPDPEEAVQELGRKYEAGDKEAVGLVREVSDLCLEGMKETLSQMGIEFDVWDWESQVIWDGRVENVLHKLSKLPFIRTVGSSATLDANAIVEAYSLRGALGLSANYEVPPLTLVRSDGTTLYPTRDIAYSLLKFAESDRVINVIGSEQALPQLQIRLALYALGEKKAADNLVHYAYGLVELPGMKMSKRRARYIALDEVLQQARARVAEAMSDRRGEIAGEVFDGIVQTVSLAAVKFAMLSVNNSKSITFTWDRVLSLERNSAPFINYAYTRAGSILKKFGEIPKDADFSLLTQPLERLLIFKIAQLPDSFCEAADQLKPEELANHANSLAEKFHEYYEKVDVIHSEKAVKEARALLVRAVQISLRNAMSVIGIGLTERM